MIFILQGAMQSVEAEETAQNYSFSTMVCNSQFSLDTIDASYSLDAGLKVEPGSDGVGTKGEVPLW